MLHRPQNIIFFFCNFGALQMWLLSFNTVKAKLSSPQILSYLLQWWLLFNRLNQHFFFFFCSELRLHRSGLDPKSSWWCIIFPVKQYSLGWDAMLSWNNLQPQDSKQQLQVRLRIYWATNVIFYMWVIASSFGPKLAAWPQLHGWYNNHRVR